MPIHSHFCGEELTELSFFSTEVGSDDCACADVGNTDCCSDITVKASIKDQSFQCKQGFVAKRIMLPGLCFACLQRPSFLGIIDIAGKNRPKFGSPPFRKLDPSALKVFRI